ncbi:type II toxin-antitoxin system YoeB family toxin [Micromonospora sp. NPDC047793]|uniref:type II toxin-antitoxin system YoeB family toxin n=1 Tax=unclassified Micromonospora TaxID=2617518 RepID=UPI0033C25C7A
MRLRIVFTPHAWEDYDGWLRRDVKMARRINDEHRLIYRIRGGDLEIAACHGHYLDK